MTISRQRSSQANSFQRMKVFNSPSMGGAASYVNQNVTDSTTRVFSPTHRLILASSKTFTLSGQYTGGLVKDGSGTLTFTAAQPNLHRLTLLGGVTSVGALNQAIASDSTLVVKSPARLQGTNYSTTSILQLLGDGGLSNVQGSGYYTINIADTSVSAPTVWTGNVNVSGQPGGRMFITHSGTGTRYWGGVFGSGNASNNFTITDGRTILTSYTAANNVSGGTGCPFLIVNAPGIVELQSDVGCYNLTGNGTITSSSPYTLSTAQAVNGHIFSGSFTGQVSWSTGTVTNDNAILSGVNTTSGSFTSTTGNTISFDNATNVALSPNCTLGLSGGIIDIQNVGSKNLSYSGGVKVSAVANSLLESTTLQQLDAGTVDIGTINNPSNTPFNIGQVWGYAQLWKSSGYPINSTVPNATYFGYPILTDGSGNLITTAPQNWSQGGTVVSTGFSNQIIIDPAGTGGNLASTPVTIASGSHPTTSGVVVNAYPQNPGGYVLPIVIPSGTTLDLDSLTNSNQDLLISGAGSLRPSTNGGTITVTNAFAITTGSIIANKVSASALVVNGTGTLSTTATNTFTGAITVNGGTFSVGAGTTSGSIPAANSVTVNATAAIQWFNGASTAIVTVSNPVTGVGTLTFKGTNAPSNGQGDYNLTGNNSGLTGTLTADSARVRIDSQNDIGSATLNLKNHGQFINLTGAANYANPINVEATADGWYEAAGNLGNIRSDVAMTLSGPISVATTANLLIGSAGSVSLNITGKISGGGGVKLPVYNTGTTKVIIGGTVSNTFTGPITMSASTAIKSIYLAKTGGAVAMVGSNILWPSGSQSNVRMGDDITVGAGRNAWDNQFGSGLSVGTDLLFISPSGCRFELQGTNQTIGRINGGTLSSTLGGIIQNQSLTNFDPGQNATLTVNVIGTNTFNGIIRDQDNGGTTRKLNLVLNTPGGASPLQTIVGNLSYTGTTTVNGIVTLEIYNSANYVSATTLNGTSTLKVSKTVLQTTSFPLSMNTGTTLTHNGLTDNNCYWVNAQAVTVASGASVILSQASVANTTTINKGAFLDGGLKGGGGGAIVTVNATNTNNGFSFRNNNSNFAGTLVVNGIASNTTNVGSGIGVGGCTTGLANADITVNGTMDSTAAGLGWANAASAFAMGGLNGTGAIILGGTLTVGSTGNSGTFSGVISGVQGVAKVGAGVQTMSGVNTYTGVTTFTTGVLSVATIGNGGVSGNLGAASVAAGNLVFNGGTLQYTGATASTNRAYTITAAGTAIIQVDGAAVLTVSGVNAATTGGLTKTGTGTLAFTAAQTFTGAARVSGGALTLGVGGTLSNATSITVDAGMTLNVSGSANNQLVTSSQTGALIVAGTLAATVNTATTLYFSSMTLNGGTLANTFGQNTSGFGAFLVNAAKTITCNGTCTISGLGVIGISSGNTLTLSTPLVGDTVNVTGTLGQGATGTAGSVLKSGLGTANMSGVNIYTGVTTINAGTLSVATIGNGGVSGNLGAAAVAASNLVLGGGTLQYTGATTSTNRNFTLTAATTSTIEVTTGANTLTISGISTATTGSLAKTGAGTLSLTAISPFTGLLKASVGTISTVIQTTNSWQVDVAGSSPTTSNSGLIDVTTNQPDLSSKTLNVTITPTAIFSPYSVLSWTDNSALAFGQNPNTLQINGTTVTSGQIISVSGHNVRLVATAPGLLGTGPGGVTIEVLT